MKTASVWKAACAIVAGLLVASGAFTQTVPVALTSATVPASGRRTHSFQVNVNLVLVPVRVSDLLHHPVTGLQVGDFEVLEDGEPQCIKYFHTEDGPISVALVLDFSASMKENIDSLLSAVSQFVSNGNPDDDYTVVAVSEKPQLLVRNTSSVAEIQSAVSAVDPSGSTALLDSIVLAVNMLKSARYERKVLLIISDGMDNSSRYRLTEVTSYIEEADIDAYAIGLKRPTSWFVGLIDERLDKKLLRRMTDVTGGETQIADRQSDIPRLAAQLSRAMRNEYVLGYRPSDGAHHRRWRTLKVILSPHIETPLRAYYKRRVFTPGD